MAGTLYIVPEHVPIQYRARACYLWQEAVMQEETTGRARCTKVTKYSYYLQPEWDRYVVDHHVTTEVSYPAVSTREQS